MGTIKLAETSHAPCSDLGPRYQVSASTRPAKARFMWSMANCQVLTAASTSCCHLPTKLLWKCMASNSFEPTQATSGHSGPLPASQARRAAQFAVCRATQAAGKRAGAQSDVPDIQWGRKARPGIHIKTCADRRRRLALSVPISGLHLIGGESMFSLRAAGQKSSGCIRRHCCKLAHIRQHQRLRTCPSACSC